MRRGLFRAYLNPSALAVGLALMVAFLTLGASAALILYSVSEVNGLSRAHEVRLVARGVERSAERLKDDLTSVTVWNEAYDKTARRFDRAFAQVNYGTYFYEYHNHDITVVLDPRDRLLYASSEGDEVHGAEAEAMAADMRQLAGLARRAAASRAAMPLGLDRVGIATAVIPARGRLYLAGASTMTVEPTYVGALLPGPETVVVTAKEIGPAYLADLKADYGIAIPRLVSAESQAQTSVPVRGVNGELLGRLSWTPEQPGLSLYRRAGPQLASGALALLLVLAGLIWLLRVLAADMVRARDLAEAGDRAKSEFIANMSHEIRTPLNGVLGMAQVMEAHDLSPEQRGRLKVVRESGATLLALLNDVLDLSKIEAGKLEIVEGPFRVEELAERVCGTFAGIAAAKGVGLELHVDPAAAGFWLGDSLRLRQVLANMISNATKFTDVGTVSVTIEAATQGLRFTVRDTGIGIAGDKLPDLFAKFTQADASTTRRYGGTGLGLAISHRLTQLMGGSIEVASREGEGSVFTLTLPVERTGQAAAPLAETPAEPRSFGGRPLRVLAAEDNPTNQLVLRALLDSIEADVTIVSDGRQAVEAFVPGRFDLVLMDVQMPQMSGPDATLAIRAIEQRAGAAPTPILALTANVMQHQIETYLDAGMDGHIAKPLALQSFFGAIDEVLSARGAGRAAA